MTSLPYFTKPRELPMPLTSVDQSSYDWHKHPHTKILLNARIRALKPDRKGMLWMLIEHAAIEVPFGSVPNEPDRLAEMAGVSAKVWDKAADAVMGAGFILCNDGRWYCPLLVDQLSPVAERRDDDQSVDAVSKAAERARRYRENKKRDVDRDAQSSERDASVTHHTSERDANVTQRDASVTIGGIKGGDKDLDSEIDLNKDQSIKSICAASQHDNDAIAQKFDLFWSVYPRKTDRKKASAAFARIKPSDDLLQTMLSVIAAWSTKWTAEPQYIPHPTTWLNGERWNDAPPATPAPQSNHHKPLNAHSEIRQNRAELMRQSLDRPFAAEVNQP